MFHSASDISDAHHRHAANETEGSEEDVDDACTSVSYAELVRYAPLVITLQNEPDALSVLLDDVSGHFFFGFVVLLTYIQIGQLGKGGDMARGDDASTLKIMVVGWVQDIFGTSSPALVASSKDRRGFHNEYTGRLLCPGEFDWENDV